VIERRRLEESLDPHLVLQATGFHGDRSKVFLREDRHSYTIDLQFHSVRDSVLYER